MKWLKDKIVFIHTSLQGLIPSLLFIFFVKFVFFCYFLYNLHHYWPQDMVNNFLFVQENDTKGYYRPLENFVNGLGYDSACRMPGLLPIYGVLRLFLSEGITKVFIIILQFVCGVMSVRALALIAKRIFNSVVYTLTLIVYTFSIFVSLWDNFGLSDSFSISFMIFSIYYLLKFTENRKTKLILLSGLFFAWSIFFRPVLLVMLPVHLLLLFNEAFSFKTIPNFIKTSFILGIPLMTPLTLWIYHNYQLTNRLIVLQDKMENCFPNAYPLHYQKLRDLAISWGGDYQRTTIGGEMHWFIDKTVDYKKQNPFPKSIFTKAYNIDSLILLREAYHFSLNDSLPEDERAKYIHYVSEKSDAYKASYIDEHYFSYLVTNRFKCMLKFCFPLRHDGIALPKLSEMSLFQKAFKGFYTLLLHFITLSGLLSGILLLLKLDKRKLIFYAYPISYIGILSGYFGFIEMRYLAPAYPFFVIFSCYLIAHFLLKSKFAALE